MTRDDRREQATRLLTGILAVVLVVAALGVVALSLSPPDLSEPYTEFYILGPNGTADEYPTNLTVNETGDLIVGISNHEKSDVDYTLVLELNDTRTTERSVTVENQETWEGSVSFTPSKPGTLKLSILLYKGDSTASTEAYQSLRLWIHVSKFG